MKKQKSYKAIMEFKQDGKEGEFTARFATLNVVDRDGDVTVPGAFRDGQEVVIEPWNHNYELPAGKGVIHADENKAWVDGKFFTETAVGKDNYLTVKELGPLAEWSYTFEIIEGEPGVFEGKNVFYLKDLDTWGVSPVTRGAGLDTRTERIKSAKQQADNEEEGVTEDDGEAEEDGKPGGEVEITSALVNIEILETD